MINAKNIITRYISFFKKRRHVQIPNAALIPENDPTTLFTSSGMQPLVPYLLAEPHPQGKRLVNVQNCFRAVDIEEVGDDRHTTFYRMLGNWSLGDYFKKEQLTWLFELLTQELKLDPKKLYVSVFKGLPAGRQGYKEIPKDEETQTIWEELFNSKNIDPKGRIFAYGIENNWWSRSGVPDNMPAGEPGGPDSEVFYDFGAELKLHENSLYKNTPCHPNCDCGRYWEICNSVFMQYKKNGDGSFSNLPKQNVDFGGGLERFLGVMENKSDIFQTSLFAPTIKTVEKQTGKRYLNNKQSMQIVADHFGASIFITASNVFPSNKERGYILRRLIRRGLDNFFKLGGNELTPVLETIVDQYKDTDPYLVEKYEHIKGVLLEEEQRYKQTLSEAKRFIEKKYHAKKIGDELKGITEISADDAFLLYTTHGLSPTQIKSIGYQFDDQAFAQKMEEHQNISRAGALKKFAGGLADHSEKTIHGHTTTHLLHQALRDVLGETVHQTGSNITAGRIRFDFNFDQKLTDKQIMQIETIVNEKIQQNLPVHYEIIPTQQAKQMGAIGLFEDTYADTSKIYFIGSGKPESAYSIEFCGGPHVEFTGELKRFKIIKQENLGRGQKRVYAVVGE